jgi:hypothetical protein
MATREFVSAQPLRCSRQAINHPRDVVRLALRAHPLVDIIDDLLRFAVYGAVFGSEPRVRGSAGRIMIRPGQAIMIAWLTAAHAPLREPAHERAPLMKNAFNYATIF